MNIFFIGVVVSILVYIVVGIWAGRSVKDVNDYYVSGRNAPTILIAGTLETRDGAMPATLQHWYC